MIRRDGVALARLVALIGPLLANAGRVKAVDVRCSLNGARLACEAARIWGIRRRPKEVKMSTWLVVLIIMVIVVLVLALARRRWRITRRRWWHRR